MSDKREKQIEFLVNELGRHGNPKWDHPIFGYEAFDINQQMYLQDHAANVLDRLLDIEDDEPELPVIQKGDHVIYDFNLRGLWAEVGAVLEGPDGEDVYYLTSGYGELPRGKKWKRHEIEKLPAPVRRFYPGDTVYVDMKTVDYPEQYGWHQDDYVQGTISVSYMTISREWMHTINYSIVPPETKRLPNLHDYELRSI